MNLLKGKIFLDNEYTIMSKILENEKVTQRELSKILGVSVSTVNILIAKMIREGLIKMTQTSQRQVLYMLTPIGMVEKAQKTISYLKIHYKAIYEIKERIKVLFDELSKENNNIFLWINDKEMKEVIILAMGEFRETKNNNIILVENNQQFYISTLRFSILVYMGIEESDLNKHEIFSQIEKINLMERI